MANLGTLTLSLVAEIGGYEKGLSKAEREAKKRAAGIEKAMQGATTAVAAGFVAMSAAAVGAFAVLNHQIGNIANFQGIAEKIGDTAAAIASIKKASDVSGVGMDTIAAASIKLTSSLSKTDDEAKIVGQAIKAIGLNFDEFKKMRPVDQIDAVAKAMAAFQDGSEKTAIATALFGKSGAELIPLFNDLAGAYGRQNTLTNEQIAAADQYQKATAALKSEFQTFLQMASVEAIPVLSGVQEILAQIAKDEATVSTATDILNGSLKAAITIFQAVAVIGSDVGFVFMSLGREIGAVAAQMNALGIGATDLAQGPLGIAAAIGKSLAQGNLGKFTAISDAVKEDGERARKELDKFQKRIMSLGTINESMYDPELAMFNRQDGGVGRGQKPKINTAGLAITSASDKAAQIAKARLDFDLAQIKAASEAITNTYANAEKIMSAQRAAGLLDEREYYGAKLAFLNLNSDEQARALQKEIERLQAEKLAGKEAIDNAKKVAEAQAKLSKVRADAAANAEVLGIQESAAFKKIAQATRDAEDAAQRYLDTLREAQAISLAGFGAGNQERDRLAGRLQIEDKYEQQRRDLEKSRRDAQMNGTFGPEAQRQYDDELDRIKRFQAAALGEYDKYFSDRQRLQDSWQLGASEAVKNYYDESRNVYRQTEELFTNAFKGMEDAMVSFVQTGKLDFKSLADSIIADLARIAIKQAITGPLSSGIGDFIGKMFGGGRAFGGPVMPNTLYRVNERGPEIFESGGSQYLMTGKDAGQVMPMSGGNGGVNVHQNVTIDARGSDVGVVAKIQQAMKQTKAETLAAVQANANRGGSFAKAVGRR